MPPHVNMDGLMLLGEEHVTKISNKNNTRKSSGKKTPNQ